MKQVLGMIVLAAALLILPGLAQAQDRGASEKFNERARGAYDRGSFPEALELFVKAYETFPDTRYLFNAGKACTRLKDYQSALHYYGRFLALSPEDRGAKKLRQEMASLERGLKRRGLLPLSLTSSPEGALVTLNGAVNPHLRLTPVRLWVKPGEHSLRLELDGYQPLEQRVEVKKAKTLDLTLSQKQRKATVTVLCKAGRESCSVSVDRAPAQVLPAGGKALKLEGGRHLLTFTAPGRVAQTKELMLKSGAQETLEVTLKREQAAVKLVPPTAGAAVKQQEPPKGLDVVKKVPVKPKDQAPEGAAGSSTRTSAYRIWSYVTMGVGAASVITGVALYSVGSVRMNNAQDDFRTGDLRYSTYWDRFTSGRDLANAGLWTTGAGLVVGATGVVLYHFFPATETVLGFSPTPDGAVLGIMRSW